MIDVDQDDPSNFGGNTMKMKNQIIRLFPEDPRFFDLWISDDESNISIYYDIRDHDDDSHEIDWGKIPGFRLLSLLYDLEDDGEYVDNWILRIDGTRRT